MVKHLRRAAQRAADARGWEWESRLPREDRVGGQNSKTKPPTDLRQRRGPSGGSTRSRSTLGSWCWEATVSRV